MEKTKNRTDFNSYIKQATKPKLELLNKPEKMINVIHLDNTITDKQRKLYNFLLSLIQNNNEDEKIKIKDFDGAITVFYKTSFTRIRNVFNMGNHEAMNKELKALKKVSITINNINDVEESYSLITEIVSNASNKDGYSDTYKFPVGKKEIYIAFPSGVKRLLEIVGDKGFSYTSIDLKKISSFRSKYSVALYELIHLYTNGQKGDDVKVPLIEFDELKKILSCDSIKKYNYISQFKNKVLDVAVKEINEKTDLKVIYEIVKNGKIQYIDFKTEKCFNIKDGQNNDLTVIGYR